MPERCTGGTWGHSQSRCRHPPSPSLLSPSRTARPSWSGRSHGCQSGSMLISSPSPTHWPGTFLPAIQVQTYENGKRPGNLDFRKLVFLKNYNFQKRIRWRHLLNDHPRITNLFFNLYGEHSRYEQQAGNCQSWEVCRNVFFPFRSSSIATQIHIEQSSMNFIEDNMTKIFDLERFPRSFVTLSRGGSVQYICRVLFSQSLLPQKKWRKNKGKERANQRNIDVLSLVQKWKA